MDTVKSLQLRMSELLAKLELRAQSCPGLYAVTSKLDFLNLALDHAGRNFLRLEELTNSDQKTLAELSHCLETLWRTPARSHELLAQSLLRHHPVPLHIHAKNISASKIWHELILKNTSQPQTF